MHIAVCDDNVADRKQLERLLGRESDKRKHSTGVFYTDSFGDSVVLSKNPMSYDLFFIDLTLSEPDGLDFALQLKSSGVTAPMVLCLSKIDYRAKAASLPANSDFIFIQKPVHTKELSAVLDQAILLLEDRTPTIELCSEKKNYYVQEDDIVYAVSNGMYVNVTLKDSTVIPILSAMDNFYYSIALFSHIVILTGRAIANVTYIEKASPFEVVLKDGTRLKSSPFSLNSIKKALHEYHAEQI